jgi:hypothetical protein
MKIEGRKSESKADVRGRKLSASAEVSLQLHASHWRSRLEDQSHQAHVIE